MAMTFRTTDLTKWGAGKGANLDPVEVDQNFWELMERLDDLETNPPAAVSIDSIEVNNNQLTIHLTDGSTQGPFTIPTATFNFTGEWRTNTVYLANDLFSFQSAIYQVIFAHTSASDTFDPNALSGSGFVYQLLLDPPPQPYDCSLFFNASIPVQGDLLMQHVVVRDFVLPNDFNLSRAFMRVKPTTQTLIFDIRKASNAFETETTIGTVTFTPGDTDNETFDGGQFGVFTGPGSPTEDVQFEAGDRLNVYAPTVSPDVQDETAIGLALTLAATTGTVV